jgi:hypothetical protein
MRKDMQWTLLFFSAASVCWIPIVWDDMPWAKTWRAEAIREQRRDDEMELLYDRQQSHQVQLHQIANEMRTVIDSLEAAQQNDGKEGDPDPTPDESGAAVVPTDPPEQSCKVTLYTADASWRCGPCDRQKQHLKQQPAFDYSIVTSPANGRSPGNRYPCWVLTRPDKTTAVRTGDMTVSQLNIWYSNEASQ